MRTFMPGWEFLNFIGGGPGTACPGLTKATGKPGLNVTNVVLKETASFSDGFFKILSAKGFPAGAK
jgi:hypothetical protein